MAWKRKRVGKAPTESHGADDFRNERTRHDINEEFADSEDEFYAGRDKILLEEAPAEKRRRKLHEEEKSLQPSDEEVFGYSVEEELDEGDFDEEESEGQQNDDVSSAGSTASSHDDEQDNLRDWGTSKKDYYNADTIETEADAMEEEAEARRLQHKQLAVLSEADFGFDESSWMQYVEEDEAELGTITEKLPDIEIVPGTAPDEVGRVLESRYPEFGPLAKDFTGLQELHKDLKLAAEAAQAVVRYKNLPRKRKLSHIQDDGPLIQTPIAVIKLRALSAYLGCITMYFALLTSTASDTNMTNLALPPAELREHPIIRSLVQSKKNWEKLKDVQLPELDDLASEVEIQTAVDVLPVNGHSETPVAGAESRQKRKKMSRAEKAVLKAQTAAEEDRAEQIRKMEASLADLSSLAFSKESSKSKHISTGVTNGNSDSDFGDEAALTAQEAAEKAQRKKSLRFYTSQIMQKANKRGAASREAGGDIDLPYKERLKDRQARLVKEAEKRGRQQATGTEKLDNESDVADDSRLANEAGGDEDEDGYYDMTAARKKQKKADKKARAEAYAEAARQGGEVYEQEEIGPDGKRAITYAIAKNKGLAPKRKKEVRNPRVKKRKKFDEKMKKLGSIRPVYKGGEPRGGYGGELTGIKTNLVKSVRL